MHRGIPALVLVLAWPAVAIGQAFSQEPELDPVFDATISITGSLGRAWLDSTLRVDASAGTPGTALDSERDLGLDDQENSGRLEVVLRPRPRHRLRAGFNFLPSDRGAREILTEDILVGDNIYAAGEEVASKLRIRTWSMAYAYSFVRSPRAEIAVSAGVTSIDLLAEVGVPARSLKESEERWIPAPQFGLDATVRFADRWYGEARYQYLRVNTSNASGSFGQLDAALVFQFDPNIAAGLAYAQVEGDITKKQVGDSRRLAFSNRGPQLFLRVSF